MITMIGDWYRLDKSVVKLVEDDSLIATYT